MRKLLLILIVLLLFFAFIAGCKRKRNPSDNPSNLFKDVIDTSESDLREGKRGGSMIRADIQELDTLNVVTTRSRSVYAVLKLVFEGLLSVHPITGTIQGGIARNYSISEDGYSILLSLNTDIRFSDNTLCTADDVLFSFEEIYMNPEVDSKKADVLRIRDSLVSITKIDDFTVRIDLPVPYRPFLYSLTDIHILPRHILQPLIEEEGIEEFNKNWGSLEGEILGVIGTGPYALKEIKRGRYIRLERNPHYSGREGGSYIAGMPYLDEIIELLDVDNETKVLKFQIGEVDFYDIIDTDIASGDIEVLLANREEGHYDLYSAGHALRGNHFLTFNQNPKSIQEDKLSLFTHPSFRRAISLLIDRERIIEDVYHGYAVIDDSPERNISPFHKSMSIQPYSPGRARNLLSQLSLTDHDGDGYLDYPSGKPLTFTLLTNEDNPFRVRIGEIVTSSLQEAGLNVEFKPIKYDLIVTKLIDTFDWDAVILGIEGSIEPNDASWIWESKGAFHLWNPYQENPSTRWEERIDVLFALGRTTWDFEDAGNYYEEYQDIIARELPIINIAIPAELYGFRRGYGNVVPRAVTYNAIGLIPYIYWKGKNKKTFTP